jgi:hypothetical protein
MGLVFGLPGLALSYLTYRYTFGLVSVADDKNTGVDTDVDDARLLHQSKAESNQRSRKGTRIAFDEI